MNELNTTESLVKRLIIYYMSFTKEVHTHTQDGQGGGGESAAVVWPPQGGKT